MRILITFSFMFVGSLLFAQEGVVVWVNEFDGSHFIVEKMSPYALRIHNKRHFGEKGYKEYTFKRNSSKDSWGSEAYILGYKHALGYMVYEDYYHTDGALTKNDRLDDREIYNVDKSEVPYFAIGMHFSQRMYFNVMQAFKNGNFNKLCSDHTIDQSILNSYGLWSDANKKEY